MLKLKHLGIMAALGFMTIGMGAGLAFAGNAIHDNSYSEVEAATTPIEGTLSINSFSSEGYGKNITPITVGNEEFTLKATDAGKQGTAIQFKKNSGKIISNTLKNSKIVKIETVFSGSTAKDFTLEMYSNATSKWELCKFANAVDFSSNAYTGFKLSNATGNAKKITSIKFSFDSIGSVEPGGGETTSKIETVNIVGPTDSMKKGETVNLKAEVLGQNLQELDKVVVWNVEPAGIAEVVSTGSLTATLKANEPGNIKVTATSDSKTLTNVSSKEIFIQIIDNLPGTGFSKEIDFSYANSSSASGYATRTITTNGFSVEITEANTYIDSKTNVELDHVRIGKKTSSVTSTITTNSPIEFAIGKINLNLKSDSLFLECVESINVYQSQDLVFEQSEIISTYTSLTLGDNTFEVPNALAKSYYRVEISLTKATDSKTNGFLHLDSISYMEYVKPVLNEIVATANADAKFYEGETPNINDFKVVAKYTPADEKIVTNATITDPTTYKLGANVVTISYTEEEVTKTVTITVDALAKRVATDLVITASWSNQTIYVPCQWDVAGIKVELLFSDNSKEDVTASLNTDFTIDFYKVGTTVEVNEPSLDMTEVDLHIAYMSDDITLEKTQTVTFNTVQVEMSLTWTNRNTTFNVGQKFSLKDGVLLAKFNNGNEETIDFVADSDRIDVLIDDISFDYKNAPLTLQDNGKQVKISYISKDAEFYATTTPSTLKVLNQKEINFIFPDSSTAMGYQQSTDGNNMNYYNHVKLDDAENVFIDCGDGTIDNGAITVAGDYRLYQQKNNGKFTIGCKPGFIISSITLTYTTYKEGTLGPNITSGQPIENIDSELVEFVIQGGKDKKGQIRISKIDVLYRELTAEEKVQNWIDAYMHMKDDAFNTEADTGACRGPKGTYFAAKEALLALGDEAVALFQNDDRFAAAELRYDRWARANLDFDNRYTAGAASNIMNITPDTTALIVVVAVTVLSVSAIAFFVISKKKRNLVK